MGRGSSSIPEGVGAWAGELPFHTWTEGQTCQVLDIIASNASYSRAYTRQRMDRRDQYRIEKKLCLQVLKDTEWMNWMIRHNLVTRNTQGVLQAKDGWDKHHLAISRLLKALREPALAIKGVLGTVTNPAQLMAGTQAHYLWSQWQSTGKNTWYFKYLALLLKRNPSWLEVTTANVSFDTRRTLSFANPTSIDQGNSNTERNKRALSRRSYQSKSKTTSPSSTSIAESRIPNSVDERVSFSTFVDLEGPNNSPDPPGIQPSQAQIASTSTGNLTNKPEAALLIPSLTKTGPQSDTISIKNGDTEISSHFNQQMFILETLDDVEPTKDINPLQLSTNCSSSPDNSPAVEATVLQIGDGDNPRDTERREIGRYSSELVSSLLDIIINEVGHRRYSSRPTSQTQLSKIETRKPLKSFQNSNTSSQGPTNPNQLLLLKQIITTNQHVNSDFTDFLPRLCFSTQHPSHNQNSPIDPYAVIQCPHGVQVPERISPRCKESTGARACWRARYCEMHWCGGCKKFNGIGKAGLGIEGEKEKETQK
ncbi:uncharacterized protein L201_006191 [Kwoniella dendrophila CBS 6074]|uniref:Uncharacterized protein n=1 Tax=Kwoniella dendrophila CBS 6074 TaxID=1295534 RepID=A0AAX4K2C3_9TREE